MIPNQETFDNYYDKIRTLKNQGDYKAALEMLESCKPLLVTKKDYTGFYAFHGDIYKLLKQYDEALEYYDMALKFNPSHDVSLYNEAKIYHILGNLEQSLEYWNRLLELEPEDAEGHYEKATVLEDMQQHEQAIEAYQLALQYNHKDISGIYNNIAIKYELLDKMPEALSYYKKALELKPDNIYYLSNLASFYALTGKYDLAIEYYEKVADVYSKDGFRSIEGDGNFDELVRYIKDSLNNTYQNLLKVVGPSKQVKKLQASIETLQVKIDKHDEELADHKAILDDSGATDKALIKRGFAMLADNPEASNYAKTFYWLTLNYIMAYRTLSTGLVQADIDAAQTASDQVIKGVVKKATSIGAELCGSIPIVGGLFGALNHIIDDLYEGILQGRTVNKGKAIAAILRAKFDLEDEISITVAKIALEMAKIRADEITTNRKISDVNIRSTISKIMEKIDKFKDKILPSVDLEDSEGAKMAVRDMTMMFAYMCANYEKICKNKNPIEKIFEGIITSGGMDDTLSAMADYNPKLEYKAASGKKSAHDSKAGHDSKAAYEPQVPPPDYEEIGNPAVRSKSPTKSPSKNKSKSPDKAKKDSKCIVMKIDDITYDDPFVDYLMHNKNLYTNDEFSTLLALSKIEYLDNQE